MASEPQPGTVAEAVARFVAARQLSEDDPRAVMGLVAVKYAEAIDNGSTSGAIGQQLNTILTQLSDLPIGAPSGPLDEHRARHHLRKAEALLAEKLRANFEGDTDAQ